jgi:chromate transporter
VSQSPAFSELVATFARIGCLSFGGPAGQIALMHRMLVEEKKWISETRFLHALNFCTLLPGPEAQQLATYVGWLLHGTRGGLAAGLLFILPGLAVLIGLSTLYALYGSLPWIAGLFFGLKAAVLAIVLEATIRVGRRALKGRGHMALAAGAFLALFLLHVPFPLLIASAGLAGFLGSLGSGGQCEVRQAEEVAPPLPRTSLARSLGILALWCGIWATPVVVVAALLGPTSLYVDLGLFFSKMAVVTFGGAYAVLTYVAEAAVHQFHWLRPGEMIDGLALAETTPGPLILVLTFVGFQSAHQSPAPLPALAGGMLGALLTTWVTFAPSFLWIFLGAPFMERLRHFKPLSGALAAITAAVVGVILNLSVWFALHVIFGRVDEIRIGPLSLLSPDWASLDIAALGLFGLSALALFRFKAGLPVTLTLAGFGGLAIRLLL